MKLKTATFYKGLEYLKKTFVTFVLDFNPEGGINFTDLEILLFSNCQYQMHRNIDFIGKIV
jgi:hypothetical protein